MADEAQSSVGPVTNLMAEGARIGIASCVQCGAAILIDPREEFDAVQRHEEWHRTSRSDPRLAFIGG